MSVRDALQSPHMPRQAEPSYLRHKTPQKIETAVLLSAWHGEEGSCAKHHNFCPRCFMHERGLTPAHGVSAISTVSDELWLCSLSPQSRAELALPWQPGGVRASRVASTACDLKLHGCSYDLWCSCSLQAWLCAVFGVHLRACSTPRQDARGEP